MKWITVFLAVTILVVTVDGAPKVIRNDNLMQSLKELDELYSSIARPSLRSGGWPAEEPKVQRAINMLRIQQLERLYADRARPRFGKRTRAGGSFPNLADYDAIERVFQTSESNEWSR